MSEPGVPLPGGVPVSGAPGRLLNGPRGLHGVQAPPGGAFRAAALAVFSSGPGFAPQGQWTSAARKPGPSV